jgi:trimeric autotransporter adhesin
MRVRSVLFATLLAVSLAAPALAGFAGTDVFLPMVGRQAGVHPSNWYTTLWIYNPGLEIANARIYLLERNAANLSPPFVDLMVAPGDTAKLENVVETYFHAEMFGAMRVTCSAKLVVTSRVYSKATGAAETDSVGQDFAGVPASFAIGVGEKTEILGVRQTEPSADSEFRFNYGLVETTGHPATVRVTVLDEYNVALASEELRVREWSQRQMAFKDHFPAVSTENARLEIEVTSGAGRVIAYGSSIANGSQDPTTFEMIYPDSLLGIGSVQHDATLTGDGTAGAPLGVADAGISPQKIAPGTTSGQVLTTIVGAAPAPGGAMAAAAGGSVAWQSLNSLSLGLTPGGVTFGNVSGGLTQDPADFFYDQANRRLGLGTPTPRDQLELTGRLRLPGTMAVGGSPIAGVLLIGDSVFLHAYGSTSNTFVGPGAGNFVLTGYNNTAVGHAGLSADTSGQANTAVGADTLTHNTEGGYNTAVGSASLYYNSTGGLNTAIGSGAMQDNTTGSGNTAVGIDSLSSSTSASYNSAIGYESLAANTVGTLNTAVGASSLSSNTAGNANTAIGSSAMRANTTGASNTAVGNNSLEANTAGQDNGALGAGALAMNTLGNSNTAIGSWAMHENTTGHSNAALGYRAMQASPTSFGNTALGARSLEQNTSGTGNTAVGFHAGYGATGSDNVLLGKYAGASETGSNRLHIANSSSSSLIYGQFDIKRVGINTTAPGQTLSIGGTLGISGGTGFTVLQGAAGQAGDIVYTLPPSNTDGYLHNNAGFLTWDAAAVGGSGTAGQLAMWTGSSSLGSAGGLVWDGGNGRLGIGTAAPGEQLDLTGSLALPATTASAGQLKLGGSRFMHAFGTDNTYLGRGAGGLGQYADTNTGLGKGALAAVAEGDANTAVGTDSLNHATNLAGNTAVGVRSLFAQSYNHCNTQSGLPCWTSNTAVGYEALRDNSSATPGADPTPGTQNTAVGVQAGLTNTTGLKNTFLGGHADSAAISLQNATAVGYGAVVDASNHVRIGNTAVTQIGGQKGWSNLSDARAKEAIRDLGLGLELVLALRPVQFRMKEGDGRTDLGFVAQDIEALLGDGYGLVGIGGDPDRTLSLRYMDLIAPLVKAVQEQQAEIAALRAAVAELQGRLAAPPRAAARP